MQVLKERSMWAAGWLPMSEVLDPGMLDTHTGTPCRACRGGGEVDCVRCGATGAINARPDE